MTTLTRSSNQVVYSITLPCNQCANPEHSEYEHWGGAVIRCSHEGCKARIKSHAWGKIKSGWFFQKDDNQYCPEHIPEWVEAWRARKK